MIEQAITLANGQRIAYLLEYRTRRTVGLKITQHGLVVHAPKRIVSHQLQQILLEKSAWIASKLALREANAVEKIQWQHGEHLLLLGQDIELQLLPAGAKQTLKLVGQQLVLAVKDSTDTTAIAKRVVRWYQQQAYEDFVRRVGIFAAKLGVPTPPVALSNAQSRWGSCNSRGQIRLSWRLIQAPPQIINHVVCHELAHLKEMNHSARFYAVLADLFPEHASTEQALKRLSPQLHRI